MRFCISGRDNLISHLLREGDIDQPVPVNVPEFPLTQAELDATESVGFHGDILPAAHGFRNGVLRSSHRHDTHALQSVL